MTAYLPPPPLTNNVCADEKLVFLRHNPPVHPNFLVAGSSIAWRNIDSAVIAGSLPGARPLNGGFCGMQINQSAFITDWMIDRLPSIGRVLLVVSPMDLVSCKGSGQVFDPEDARKLVFEGQPMWSFYLRYFDPISLRRNIDRQIQIREQARILKVDRSFTKYGDAPLDTDENRGLFYGPMPEPDPSCFSALRALASELAERNRSMTVVIAPMHPRWKSQYDPDGTFRERFSLQLKRALQGTGAQFWNADGAKILDASAFTDAIHIRWSSARTLTKEIVERLAVE
ncbi:hypothetical protein [Dongia deserti]|uniref:hypothetical protein n=1 Tax=Dongia deserti TaxID=2268030 RepID=UPI0013C52A7A|nr:hypothetical protein [Dongia deserti]